MATGKTVSGKPAWRRFATAEDPWVLKTPPLSSEFTMHRDTIDGTEMLVCTVGKTVLHYEYRCLKDLHAMLKAHVDWMELGGRAEAREARHRRGVGALVHEPHRRLVREEEERFAMYPPLMEALGMAEVEHNPRNNRMRAL